MNLTEIKILDLQNFDPYEINIGEIFKIYENNKYILIIISDIDKDSGDISYEYIYS